MGALDPIIRFSTARLAPLRRSGPSPMTRGRRALMMGGLALGFVLVVVWCAAIGYGLWRLAAFGIDWLVQASTSA